MNLRASTQLVAQEKITKNQKKKGDFGQSHMHDTGGNKKQDNSRATGKKDHQNAGHGGHC